MGHRFSAHVMKLSHLVYSFLATLSLFKASFKLIPEFFRLQNKSTDL